MDGARCLHNFNHGDECVTCGEQKYDTSEENVEWFSATCDHDHLIWMEYYQVCSMCGLEFDTNFNIYMAFRAPKYKSLYIPNEYVINQINLYLGLSEKANYHPNNFIENIVDQLPDLYTWADVKKVCPSFETLNYLLSMPYLFGLKPKMPKHFWKHYNNFKKLYQLNHKKRPPFQYVLYKSCQLTNTHQHVPLAMSKKKIKEYDKLWNMMAYDEEIPVLPTEVCVLNKKDITQIYH